MNKIVILNVAIDNITQDELLVRLKKGVLVTPNVRGRPQMLLVFPPAATGHV